MVPPFCGHRLRSRLPPTSGSQLYLDDDRLVTGARYETEIVLIPYFLGQSGARPNGGLARRDV
ncbi:MAG: hypothetical protein R2839_00570 [Thermomicrobiales bacterium]